MFDWTDMDQNKGHQTTFCVGFTIPNFIKSCWMALEINAGERQTSNYGSLFTLCKEHMVSHGLNQWLDISQWNVTVIKRLKICEVILRTAFIAMHVSPANKIVLISMCFLLKGISRQYVP
jgi:hypothetical protein